MLISYLRSALRNIIKNRASSLAAGLIILLTSILTMGNSVYKAATRNPIETIRYE